MTPKVWPAPETIADTALVWNESIATGPAGRSEIRRWTFLPGLFKGAP